MQQQFSEQSIRLSLKGTPMTRGNVKALDYAVRVVHKILNADYEVSPTLHKATCEMVLKRLATERSLRPENLVAELEGFVTKLYKSLLAPSRDKINADRAAAEKSRARESHKRLLEEALKRRTPVPNEQEPESEFVAARAFIKKDGDPTQLVR